MGKWWESDGKISMSMALWPISTFSWSMARVPSKADQSFDLGRFDFGSFWPRLHGCGRNWGYKKIQMLVAWCVQYWNQYTFSNFSLLIVVVLCRCSAVPKAAKLCLGFPNASHAMHAILRLWLCPVIHFKCFPMVAVPVLLLIFFLPKIGFRWVYPCQNIHCTMNSCFTPPSLHHEASKSAIFLELWVHLRYDSSRDLRLSLLFDRGETMRKIGP